MEVTMKELTTLVVVVGTFIGLCLDKIPLEVALSLISSAVSGYTGYRIGVRKASGTTRKC